MTIKELYDACAEMIAKGAGDKEIIFYTEEGEPQLIDNGFESPDDFMFSAEIYSYASRYCFEGTKSEIREKIHVLS